MGPIPAVRSVLRQYATFRGRARRSEFWWFTLAVTVATYVATAIDSAVFGTPWDESGPVYLVLTAATIVPSLAVSWRRLHDTDHHGAWTFVALIPVVGWIIYLVFVCSDSHDRPNRFGPSPKHPVAAPGRGQGYGPGYGTTA